MKEYNKLPSLVFFGTPEFAKYCLEKILKAGFNVKAVITAPDRKAGRGNVLRTSSVKELAINYNLQIYQPKNLKNPNFLNKLRNLNPDIQVVVAFRMLPKSVWQIPRLGTINLHASLLPNYRGAAPINWVLIEGEKKTGVTTFFIDDAIDSGAILMQNQVNINKYDDAESLSNKLLLIGAPLIIKTLESIWLKKIVSRKQKLTGLEKESPKLTSENTRLDWSSSLEELRNKIRGLSPYPGAWTQLRNNDSLTRIKIFKAEKIYSKHKFPIKKIIIESNKLLITNSEGFLNCLIVQLSNKKQMSAKALLNGYKFYPNSNVF